MMNQSVVLRSVHIVNPKKENQFITTPTKMLNTYLQNIDLKGSQIISLPGRPHLGPALAGLIIFSEASVSSTCTPDASINETHLFQCSYLASAVISTPDDNGKCSCQNGDTALIRPFYFKQYREYNFVITIYVWFT